MTELYRVHLNIYSYYKYKQVERLILLSVVKQGSFPLSYHEKNYSIKNKMKHYLLIQQSMQD